MSVEARDGYLFSSNTLTIDEGLWLEELFTSPEVRVLIPEKITWDRELTISSVTRRIDGTANLGIIVPVTLLTGLAFYYSVTGGSQIGMSDTGTGEIIAYDGGILRYQTNIPASGGVLGTEITGTAYVNYQITEAYSIPIILTSTSFEEKERGIRYTIEARPSFKKNIQRQ
jgi:hypothetical protein